MTDEPEDRDCAGPKDPKPTSAERATGYKSPPHEHKFRKGTSGNPRGRPKGARGKRKLAEKVLLERHVLTENGEQRAYTTLQLILLVLRQMALEGNTRAAKIIQTLEDKYGPQEPDRRGGVLVVPGRVTQKQWDQLFAPKDNALSETREAFPPE